MAVYLIHFEKPYKQARHYLGSAGDLAKRITEHKKGMGSRLLAVVNAAGIGWSVARVWEGGDQNWENRLKELHRTPDLCPVCNPNGWKKKMSIVDNQPIKRKYHKSRKVYRQRWAEQRSEQ